MNTPNVTAFIANDPSLVQLIQANITSSVQETVSLIEYAVIPGRIIYSPFLTNGSSFATAAGVNVTITVLDGSTYVNNARITQPDVLVYNGVLHVIDKVIIPSRCGSFTVTV
jgi:uncharacterized surface protein with fasciclin (FAS1) repeats